MCALWIGEGERDRENYYAAVVEKEMHTQNKLAVVLCSFLYNWTKIIYKPAYFDHKLWTIMCTHTLTHTTCSPTVLYAYTRTQSMCFLSLSISAVVLFRVIWLSKCIHNLNDCWKKMPLIWDVQSIFLSVFTTNLIIYTLIQFLSINMCI